MIYFSRTTSFNECTYLWLSNDNMDGEERERKSKKKSSDIYNHFSN